MVYCYCIHGPKRRSSKSPLSNGVNKPFSGGRLLRRERKSENMLKVTKAGRMMRRRECKPLGKEFPAANRAPCEVGKRTDEGAMDFKLSA